MAMTSRRRWIVGLLTGAAFIPAIVTLLIAAAGDTTADRELGQFDFAHSTSPSFARAKSLALTGSPRGNGVAVDGAGHLYVVDTNNNRVLGWTSASSFANGDNAAIVIGAPDFYTHNQGCARTATGLCGPIAVGVDPSGDLFVSGDHVEEFSAPFSQAPPISGTTFVPNGSLDPWGVASDSHGDIYVAFRNQNEVVEYNSGSTTPNLVFGQASSSGGSCNQGGSPSATTLCAPYGVAVDSADNLYVADTGNNRALEYFNPLGAAVGGAGDATADIVIGQAGFTTGPPGSLRPRSVPRRV